MNGVKVANDFLNKFSSIPKGMFVVSGNIGSGKSTFATRIVEYYAVLSAFLGHKAKILWIANNAPYSDKIWQDADFTVKAGNVAGSLDFSSLVGIDWDVIVCDEWNVEFHHFWEIMQSRKASLAIYVYNKIGTRGTALNVYEHKLLCGIG